MRFMRYRSTRCAVFSVKYDVIWRRVLGGAAGLRLKQIIDEGVAEFDGMVIEVETLPDHVHLLVELAPKVAVSRLVEILTSRCSRRLRQEFPHLARMNCLWAPPYFVSIAGGARLEVVRRYVENQKLTTAGEQARVA